MTRMWMIDPESMCRQHMLGEHKELHQLVGSIRRGRWSVIEGHARLGQIECRSIRSRHEELVQEMMRRGYRHNSPLPDFNPLDIGTVSIPSNISDLKQRCPECRDRMAKRNRRLLDILKNLTLHPGEET